MNRWWIAGGTVVVAAAVGAGVLVWGGPDDRGRVQMHRVTEKPGEVEDYWTEERMREAKPAPMPKAP